MNISNYISRVVNRRPARPEVLIEHYSPVFIQTALQYFFDNAVMSIDSEGTSIKLMEYLPLCQQGYVVENALLLLMYIYVIMNNLLELEAGVLPEDLTGYFYVIPDGLFIEAFASKIPAFYYSSDRKMTMQDALIDELIPGYLNTFEAIRHNDLDFEPDTFHVDYLFEIIDMNSGDINEFPVVYKYYTEDSKFRETLIDEFMIVRDMYIILMRWLESHIVGNTLPKFEGITVTAILESSITYHTDDLSSRLLADDRINKLIYAIIVNSSLMVERYIDKYDPRSNNYEAYHLAVAKGNLEIIQRIKKAIAERNFLEQQTFQNMMVPLGESDLPQTGMFHQYSRSLLK